MKADVLWVVDGRLAILPRPRGGEWLSDEIRSIAAQGIQIVLSLLTPSEEAELGLADEAVLADRHGLDFMRYPVPDRGVPRSPELFSALISELTDSGRTVGVHCRAGIGRSGVTCAAMLMRLGHNPEEALTLVSKARGVAVPDTTAQKQWLLDHRAIIVGK
jgi:protein-tyrosine phosphatase